jgi:hypothetical protein
VLNGAASRTAGAGATTLDWDGLAPETYMCFKVRAFNAAGVSPVARVVSHDEDGHGASFASTCRGGGRGGWRRR